MQVSVGVRVNLSQLVRFKQQVDSDLRNTTNGPIRKALKQWAARYRSFAQERFDAYSKGGGDWPPLADSTIAARRKPAKKPSKPKKKKQTPAGSVQSFFKFVTGKKKTEPTPTKGGKGKKKKKSKRQVAILRNLGILYAVLSPTFSGKPGSVEAHKPFGVTVGYGGPHKYPAGKGVSIADIASFHQNGAGKLPVRRIIVDPPSSVVEQMAADMERAMREMTDVG